MILITGAAGHLGTALVRELAERGESLRLFVLPGEDVAPLDGTTPEIVRGDVRDAVSMRAALRGVDTVYHLAGIISIMPGRDDLMRQVNVEGTANVACQARAAGVRRMVFVSSIHALARPPEGRPIDETVPFDPTSPAGEYDRTKAGGSLSVLAEVSRGLDAVIICPTGIIGPYQSAAGSPMIGLVRKWMKPGGHVVVNGHFDFVDVRDVARGLVLAAERGRCGEAYIIRGERVSVPALLGMVREASGHGGLDIIAPFRLALLAAAFATLHARLWKTRVGFTRYALETLVSNSVISGDKAMLELGYSPRPLRETIRDTVLWLSGNPSVRTPEPRRGLRLRGPAASPAG